MRIVIFHYSRFITGMIALVVILCATQGMAQNHAPRSSSATLLPYSSAPYPLRTRGLQVEEALRLFAKNLRIGLIIADGVDGEIMTEFPNDLSRAEYIDELASMHDFLWYFDNQVLRVSPVNDLETSFIPLRDNSGEAIIDVLKQLGIYQDKFIHRAGPRNKVLMVSGPSSYTDMVSDVAETVEEADRIDATILRGTTTQKTGSPLSNIGGPSINTDAITTDALQ